MFSPKTRRIEELAKKYPSRIEEIEKIFDKPTKVYIDFANVIHWQDKLGWHIGLKRLKQFLDSFDTIDEVKFYYGELKGNSESRQLIRNVKKRNYTIVSKPVKIMRLSIDVSSIPLNSTIIIEQFIRQPLLQKLNVETIEFLNNRLKDLNRQGILALESRKCNFDVEIGRDMFNDSQDGDIDNFGLWSGDSDFSCTIEGLLKKGKKVIIFSTARKVSVELNELRKDGLIIFEIKKIRDFICYAKEIKRGP